MQPIIPYNSRAPPDKYHRGMFFDVSCYSTEVFSYGKMRSELEKLKSEYPDDVHLFSAGQSEGFGGPDNSLEVIGMHIPATGEPERTVFFAAGHHPEYSGPQTAFLIAKGILKKYCNDDKAVQAIRKNTNIIIMPQLDPDIYNNLDKMGPRATRWWTNEFYEEGYGTIETEQMLEHYNGPKWFQSNFYGDLRQYLWEFGYNPPRQALEIKESIKRIIENEPPVLSFDFHEGIYGHSEVDQMSPENKKIIGINDPWVIWKYTDIEWFSDEAYEYIDGDIETRSYPLYALLEAEQDFPGKIKFDPEAIDTERGYTFDEFLASLGAESILFETSRQWTLEDRIRFNLIVTDRILARHFFGI